MIRIPCSDFERIEEKSRKEIGILITCRTYITHSNTNIRRKIKMTQENNNLHHQWATEKNYG